MSKVQLKLVRITFMHSRDRSVKLLPKEGWNRYEQIFPK